MIRRKQIKHPSVLNNTIEHLYNANSLEILDGLDPVKRRPSMYTDTENPNHMAQELIDNSADEAIAGFANEINVTLFKDGSLSIKDNGRGIPTDTHKKENISGIEVIMLKLHAGAKFSNKNYQFSGGLHGVGISVVNALSYKVYVEIQRNNTIKSIVFENGVTTQRLKVLRKTKKKNTGTYIRFWPNPKYFANVSFTPTYIRTALCAKAFLCPALKVTFKNELSEKSDTWYFKHGPIDYLKKRIENYNSLIGKPFIGCNEMKGKSVSWAITWHTEKEETVTESYVNLIHTPYAGTHVNAFRSGLLAATQEFCNFRKILPAGVKLTADDICEHANYVLSVKLTHPQFSGQTKKRLVSNDSISFISGSIKNSFGLWLNCHSTIGKELALSIITSAQRRLQTANKPSKKQSNISTKLPSKLSDCISQNLSETELFIVEGDSAGGSAKQARHRQTQAVIPLRGKILNTWEMKSSNILTSKEINNISMAIGIKPNADSIDGLRYGKICILSDADSDGLHIATLLCALFLRHFKILVESGHIFVAMPPLYRIDIGNKVYYATNDVEKIAIIKQMKKNFSVQRFKGLGEMNPLQLRETTMNPNTRRLIQLTIGESIDPYSTLDMLLGKKRAIDRKIWLESNDNTSDF